MRTNSQFYLDQAEHYQAAPPFPLECALFRGWFKGTCRVSGCQPVAALVFELDSSANGVPKRAPGVQQTSPGYPTSAFRRSGGSSGGGAGAAHARPGADAGRPRGAAAGDPVGRRWASQGRLSKAFPDPQKAKTAKERAPRVANFLRVRRSSKVGWCFKSNMCK